MVPAEKMVRCAGRGASSTGELLDLEVKVEFFLPLAGLRGNLFLVVGHGLFLSPNHRIYKASLGGRLCTDALKLRVHLVILVPLPVQLSWAFQHVQDITRLLSDPACYVSTTLHDSCFLPFLNPELVLFDVLDDSHAATLQDRLYKHHSLEYSSPHLVLLLKNLENMLKDQQSCIIFFSRDCNLLQEAVWCTPGFFGEGLC